MNETIRSIIRVHGFRNSEMDFQLLRQLGSVVYGGASIGESLALAARINTESAEQWVSEFANLANKQHSDADIRLNKGHSISAKKQYLKACNSYRAAEYYSHINKSEHRKFGLLSRDCFIKYINISSFDIEVGFINHEGLQLPYYFIAPDKSLTSRKTIIIVSGFDGTLEESFIQSGLAALERGYNIVCFAGPGQIDTWRFNDKTNFQPNFEVPMSKLLDVLQENPLIDFLHLTLLGISFGGNFAARVACYEQRIKALVLNSPICDLRRYVLGFSFQNEDGISQEEDFTYQDIPFIPDSIMPTSLKELTANLLLRFGNHSMKQTVDYLDKFNIRQQLNQIICPTLALVGKGEGKEPYKQYQEFMTNVKNISGYEFSIEDGADTHCQLTNLDFSNCIIYDWLDELK